MDACAAIAINSRINLSNADPFWSIWIRSSLFGSKATHMAAADHPEFSLEVEHLQQTLTALEGKINRIEQRGKQGGDAHATHALIELEEKEYARLQRARPKPYFGRIDLRSEDRTPLAHYIGTHGFEHDGVMVIDWRAPLARVFYTGKPGRVTYDAPEGRMTARLMLKRLFEIQAQKLLNLTDEFDERREQKGARRVVITDPDQYLKQVIEGKQDTQLGEIVATIQREQDALVRANPNQVLIVQGVAGSGKTSVALHRLAYLLYPGLKSGMDAKRCIIFGPNRFFLGYIADVLPSLGIEQIPQTTIADWVRAEMGLDHYQMTDAALDAILANRPRQEKLAHYYQSRLKNSPAMGALLKHYVETRRVVNFPEAGLTFDEMGPLRVEVRVTREQLQEFHTAFAQLPFARQRDRFIERVTLFAQSEYENAVRRRATELAASGEEWFARAQNLRAQAEALEQLAIEAESAGEAPLQETRTAESLRKGAEGLRAMASLYVKRGEPILDAAASQRERALELQVRRAVNERLTRRVERAVADIWTPLDLPNDYYVLLANRGELEELAKGIFKAEQIEQLHQPDLPITREIDFSDLAALHCLHIASQGVDVPPFDHIVIDEAQDVSPLQFENLQKYSRYGSLTILGDLAQSIYAHRGVASWDEARRAFPAFKVSTHELIKSYRSTYEIIRFANVVLHAISKDKARVPIAEPLKRHGTPPELHPLKRDQELAHALVRVITRTQQGGYRNIAVIAKTTRHATRVAEQVRAVGYEDLELVTSPDFRYKGGTVVVPVHLAKGMEFEAGLVVNVDNQTYSETEFDGRLLYVALTRALHALHLFWTGEVAAHLKRAVVGLERMR
jgi:DNA helicase-2/ATP-dependent DNA helicase PcrA